jgi:uncharacterized protein YqeY
MSETATLRQTIQDAMIAAMRAQEKDRLLVIRSIQAAIKQQEVDQRITLSQEQILSILDKMLRQRRESIKQFELGNRQDLIDKENYEITLIQGFLPQPLSDAEIIAMVKQAIQDSGATTIRDMGKVMGILKPKVQGRADIGMLGELIKQQLSVST